MENLTSEQKKAKYNLAIEILTKAVEEFYNGQKLKFANEIILNGVTQEEILNRISEYLYQGLSLEFHRKIEEIKIRDIQEYGILDNFTGELSNIIEWDLKDLCFILFELEKNKEIIYSKNLVIFSEYQKNKYLQEKDVEFDLNDFGQTIQDLTNQALEGERDLLKTFVLLKRIEKGVKTKCDDLKGPALSQYIDRQLNPRDEVAFGYGFTLTSKKTINFTDDEEYAKINKILKEREDILKNAVNQSEKNNTVVDENGEIIQPPSYSYSSSLVIKKV